MKKLFTLFALLFLFASNILSQNVEVSTGGPATNYMTLKAAFDAINAGTHTGTILIELANNTTETASCVLNASGSGSASYTSITIRPTGGAARTISGAIVGLPLIDLNGADNVSIDGLNSGGNSLTISNTSTSSTSGTSTIRFQVDATNNKITQCSILGSATIGVSAGTNGGNIWFGAGSTSTGSDGNKISFCDIGPAGTNLPTRLIWGNGTPANPNSSDTISNCNLFDFFSSTAVHRAIDISAGCTDWVITENRFYQTSSRTQTTGTANSVIRVSNASGNNFQIINNIIGFANSSGTGTYVIGGSTNTFRAIDLPNVGTTTATSIQGNTISGINFTTAATTTGTTTGFVAIMLGTTAGRFDVGNVSGNTIGSLDGSSTIVVNSSAGTGTINGIYDFSLSASNISNNNIGNITIQGPGTSNGFRGILVNTASGVTATITNNTIANITNTQTGSYALYAIQTALPSVVITGNTIRDFTGNANVASTVIATAISVNCTTATASSTISGNTIYSLNNNSGTVSNSIYSMDLSLSSTANVIERNLVHSINITSTVATCQLWGIVMRGFGTATFKNNMIRLGLRADGTSITSGFSVIGMRELVGATASYYNNSVYIGGTGVVSSSNTYCFLSSVVTNTRNFSNNIFWNARSNGSGTIANVSIGVGGTAPNPAGLTCNYNLLFANGVSGVVGVFNGIIQTTMANWRTATGQDAKSISRSPDFVNPTGTSTTLDLHISPTSLSVNGRGTYIASVTNDYDGNSRPTSQSTSVSPVDMGADQYSPSGFTGNNTDVLANTLVDGELTAIELVAGEFNFTEILQFTGTQTPNNTMRPSKNNEASKVNINTIVTDNSNHNSNTETISSYINYDKSAQTTIIDLKAEDTPSEIYTKVTDNTITQIPHNNGLKTLSAKNNLLKKSPVQKHRDGNSGAEPNRSAVNTTWIYWRFIDFTPDPLNEPITMRFYYNDEQLATITEASLQIAYWDGSSWDNTFTQSVNTTSNYIEVTLPDGLAWPPDILFAIAGNDAPLPVVLTDFNITAMSRDANLSWGTSSELNNKGFSIERRALISPQDARYSDWKEIAFVNGKGTTTEPQSYTYGDKKLNSGTYQYRLRQVDFNGNFEYFSSNQSDVVIGKPGVFDVSQNYPNPSNPKSKIDFQMPFDGMVSIKVYDILGQEVKSLVNEFRAANFYTVEFDGSNLASGIYFYRISAEGGSSRFTRTLKMVLVK